MSPNVSRSKIITLRVSEYCYEINLDTIHWRTYVEGKGVYLLILTLLINGFEIRTRYNLGIID